MHLLPRLASRARFWIPPAAYAGLIFYLSAQPKPVPLLTSIVWDKALHAVGYAGLALLVLRAVRREGVGWRAAALIAVIAASAYGVTDELHQSVVPGRQADILDWMADTVGAILGSAGYRTFRERSVQTGGPRQVG